MAKYGPVSEDIAQIVASSLLAYKAETQRYLVGRSNRLNELNNYDYECCDKCMSEHRRLAMSVETDDLLGQRLDLINKAVKVFGPSLQGVQS